MTVASPRHDLRVSRRPEARALFSFESLAAYERYRALFGVDPEFVAADRIREESGCGLRYRRTFMRPLRPDWSDGEAEPG